MENFNIKSLRPIDYLPDEPLLAIAKAVYEVDVRYALRQLSYWFYMALSGSETMYTKWTEQTLFIMFYHDFLPFVEAIHFLNDKSIESIIDEHLVEPEYRPYYLSENQAAHPIPIIREFSIKYPIAYLRRELWDFMNSVQRYEGQFKKELAPLGAGWFYDSLLTWVEAAHIITSESHFVEYAINE